jgi:DNA (cytosine-5)-methyltransferase 1
MNHVSLCTGIGGFDLAAERAGFTNIGQVEIDDYCNLVLEKNFPEVPKFRDIYDFTYSILKSTLRHYGIKNRKIDLLTAGFPCQPFSVAGQRRASKDDRFLWYEVLRVITEILPEWLVLENVQGIIYAENGLVFGELISSLENLGYEVQTFDIPAIGKNAPHLRHRIWFVAHRDSSSAEHKIQARRDVAKSKITSNSNDNTQRKLQQKRIIENKWGRNSNDTKKCNTDTMRTRCEKPQGIQREKKYQTIKRILMESKNSAKCNNTERKRHRFDGSNPLRQQESERFDYNFKRNWFDAASELCRVDDGSAPGLDGTGVVSTGTEIQKKKGSNGNYHRIKACGNGIVWTVAYEILETIVETMNIINKMEK